MSVFKNACLCVINLLKSLPAAGMEQARLLHLLINTELREHRYPRAGVMEQLYADVVDLMDQEEGLTWSAFCRSSLLGSVVEMAGM